MSSDLALAGKYAKAFFAAAVGLKQEKSGAEALKKAEDTLLSLPSLVDALQHPAISLADKMALIKPLLAVSPLLPAFIELLISRKRLSLLPEIQTIYQALWDVQEGIEPVTVSSASELNASQRQRLEKALPTWLGKKIRFEWDVEPDLIGGLRIRTRDAECDQSLRGRLDLLQKQLLATV